MAEEFTDGIFVTSKEVDEDLDFQNIIENYEADLGMNTFLNKWEINTLEKKKEFIIYCVDNYSPAIKNLLENLMEVTRVYQAYEILNHILKTKNEEMFIKMLTWWSRIKIETVRQLSRDYDCQDLFLKYLSAQFLKDNDRYDPDSSIQEQMIIYMIDRLD